MCAIAELSRKVIVFIFRVYDSVLCVLCVQMSSRPLPATNRRKRAQPAVSGGVPGSYDNKDSNFAW